MKKRIFVNALSSEEIRIALIEDSRLEGFFIETANHKQIKGNIYKGIVTNIEPSLQAAFVDYGGTRDGFLQIGDIRPEFNSSKESLKNKNFAITDALYKGQEILVQIVKEENRNKGASLTTYISLPGQSLVLTIGREVWGISRKIDLEIERNRIKKVLNDIKDKFSKGVGIIARTAAEGRLRKDIFFESKVLFKLWEDIKKRGENIQTPSLVHKEQELAIRAVRDLFTSDIDEILVDNREVQRKIKRFISIVNPRRKSAVRFYCGNNPIFVEYGIEEQLLNVYSSRVRLPSGGYIIISPTEALVSIDVNSGKAIRGKRLEETAANVNLEAAFEIARQMRLRNLGGLVVIDFIDMKERKHQLQVLKKIKDEIKKDKAKVTVGNFSRFGLIELSRQRIRSSVDFSLVRICCYCQGRGFLRTREEISRSILRTLDSKIGEGWDGILKIFLAPEIAHYLLNFKRIELTRLEIKSGVCFEIVKDFRLSSEEVGFTRLKRDWNLKTFDAFLMKK